MSGEGWGAPDPETLAYWDRDMRLKEETRRRLVEVCEAFKAESKRELFDHYGEDALGGDDAGDLAAILLDVVERVVHEENWIDYLADELGAVRDIARSRPDGYVYVLQAGEFYKIGRTKHLAGRIKTLAIQLPFPARVIHAMPCDGMVEAERWLHGVFADYRANGEWFRLPTRPLPKTGVEWLRSIRYFTRSRSEMFPEPTSAHMDVPAAVLAEKHWERAFMEAAAAVDGDT